MKIVYIGDSSPKVIDVPEGQSVIFHGLVGGTHCLVIGDSSKWPTYPDFEIPLYEFFIVITQANREILPEEIYGVNHGHCHYDHKTQKVIGSWVEERGGHQVSWETDDGALNHAAFDEIFTNNIK